MKKAVVWVPGSCGELVQGRVDGVSFQVTCPVKIFSQISVYSSRPGRNSTFPPDKVKAAKAAKKTLALLEGQGVSFKLEIKSQIPVGKGMASSTADIVGSCLAMANLLGKRITPFQIAQIASEIEPTDGLMYNGVVCFDHIRGTLIEKLGFPPPMKILIVDPGGEVDTLGFNKRGDLYLLHKVNLDLVKEAYLLVKEGIRRKNPKLIGMGATVSSLCNQIILYKPELKMVISVSRKMGAFGVSVAHSGSVMGIFLPPDFSKIERLEERVKAVCGHGHHLRFYQTETITGSFIKENGYL